MTRYLKFLLSLLIFETLSCLLFARKPDSINSTPTTSFVSDSLPGDTIKKNTISQLAGNNFTPDTVFLINGDKLTGNIIAYNEGRLKIDAQSAGTISIKSSKIFSISGGSRQFKIEDVRKEIYIGQIFFSKDTGEIMVTGKVTQNIKFNDLLSLYPFESLKDSLSPNPITESEKSKLVIYTHAPDTVYLRSGDRITGRILSFEQGRLKMDAQASGDISIKWHKIASLYGSSRLFKVEDIKGDRYIGQIEISKDTGEIIVQGQMKHGISLENVVRIYPLEEEWYRGFKGDVGAGFNYSKSSEVLNLNADYNLYYVISKWRFINNFSYIETSTEQSNPSTRIEFDLQELYALPQRWVFSEISSFNRNDELGIDSRISFNLGGGNNLVQNEKQRLLVLTGIVQNSEKNIESNSINSTFEWPASIQYIIYSFASPNLSATTKATSYVGITEKGRYRIDASTDVTYEFITDVKFKFTIYYNYDNKVLEGKNSQEDYGTTLSLIFDLK